MMVQTTERTPADATAVDEREQALFLPRPDEPVTVYAQRLRVLRENLDTLIATVERGAQARTTVDARATAVPATMAAPAPALPSAAAPSAPSAPSARPVATAGPARVEIIRVDDARAARIAADERRWATERRQRLTERRIAPDRRVGRADHRSHPGERRGPVLDRRGVAPERREAARRAAVIPEPRPVLDPITWVWVLQVVIWVGIAVAALALT